MQPNLRAPVLIAAALGLSVLSCIDTGWPQKLAHFVLLITSSKIDQFSNLFHCQKKSPKKFCIKLPLKILAHLKCVAILPCEMSIETRLL